MSKFDLIFPPVSSGWLRQLWLWYHFKFVVPQLDIISIDGIRLDVSSFSSKVRNRILIGYEEAERKLCQELLVPEDSVLEVGGGIGFIGLFCQKRIGITHYTSTEANPMTIEILKKNYHLNGLSPHVRHTALGKENGKVELQIGTDFWAHSIAYPKTANRRNTIKVPSATLATLLAETQKNINVLIIDIEGAERFINFDEIGAGINKIIIELHPRIIGRKATWKILAALTDKGFRMVNRAENTFALRRKTPIATV